MLTVFGRRSSFNLQKVMWLVGELGLEHRHIPAGGQFGGLDTREFRAMNRSAAFLSSTTTALGANVIAVPLEAPEGERYIAHVLPLTAGARRRAGIAYDAVAVAFVQKVAVDVSSASDALLKAYNLTTMELTVLLRVVQLGGGPIVAQDLGISETTVRTHLKHVFQKTGTHRQADLAKLVAGFERPFVNPQKPQARSDP
jgi:DNA-binding CsgD family transcriptional regulator